MPEKTTDHDGGGFEVTSSEEGGRTPKPSPSWREAPSLLNGFGVPETVPPFVSGSRGLSPEGSDGSASPIRAVAHRGDEVRRGAGIHSRPLGGASRNPNASRPNGVSTSHVGLARTAALVEQPARRAEV